MKTFLLIAAREADEGYVPYVKSTGTAENIEEIVEQWVNPTTGWVPDHIENICDDYDEYVSDAAIKAEAVRITKERFGIGCERNAKYSNDYRIVEVDLTSGEVTIYGD